MKTKLTIITAIFILAVSARAYSESNYSTMQVEIEKGHFIEIDVFEEKEVDDLDLDFSEIYAGTKGVEKEEGKKEEGNIENEEGNFDINEIIYEEEAVEYEIDTEKIFKEIMGQLSDVNASV